MRPPSSFCLSLGRFPRDDLDSWPTADAASPSGFAASAGRFGIEGVVRGGSHAVARSASAVVVLAGELYDRLTLRRVVGSEDRPDAETLLALVERYGLAAPRLLDARCAGFIVQRDRAMLFTDHGGTVPLFYAIDGDELACSTEAKSLVLGARAGDGVLAADRLSSGLRRRETPFSGVWRVPSGTGIVFDLTTGRRQAMRMWGPPSHRQAPSDAEARARITDLLRSAVADRVPGGAPVGVVLSGGIDSSIVAALACEVSADVRTFTLATPQRSELAEARVVADALQTRHREILVDGQRLLETLPEAVWAAEVHMSQFVEYLQPLCLALRVASEDVERVLTGYGSDITLGGMHDPQAALERLDAGIAADLVSTDGSNEFTPVVGTAHGVWTAHPFWGRDVVDYLAGLEPGLKARDGWEKHVLRTAFDGQIPPQAAWRRKVGVHESTGLVSVFDRALADRGIDDRLLAAKDRVVHRLLQLMYNDGVAPADVSLDLVFDEVAETLGMSA